ncbi:MAG: YybS family protein [Peptococcaceae bacterium]|nr:YybS family protein [Peptococcaceae bacterium]
MTNLPEEEKKELSQTPEQLEETQPLWVEDRDIEPKLGVPTDLREEEACYNQPAEVYQRMTQPVLPQGGARTLAVGAMCACLVVVLSLIGYYIPVMSPLLAFMVPLPMVVAGLMCGLATGLVSLVAASVLLAMFIGPLSAVTVGVRYCLLGLALGVCFRRGYSGGKVFAIVTVVSTVSIALGTVFSFWIAGIPILQGIEKMIASVTVVYDTLAEQEQMLALLPPGMGMDEYIAVLKRTTVAILPATFVIYCMLIVWVNYLVSSFVLGRMGYRVTPLPAFSRWQMPLSILWLAMAGFAFGIAGNYLQMELLANISFNLLYMTIPLFLLCGMSVLYYYLQRREIPQLMKMGALLFLIIFAAFGFVVLTVVGMFDAVFDWRNLHGAAARK